MTSPTHHQHHPDQHHPDQHHPDQHHPDTDPSVTMTADSGDNPARRHPLAGGGAARHTPRVRGLRIGTSGHRREITVPAAVLDRAVAPRLGVLPARAGGGFGREQLDTDLIMLFDLDGAEHAGANPSATAIAALFGGRGPIHGPVVFLGWVPGGGAPGCGRAADIPAAASILLAGATRGLDRAGPFAGLDLDLVPAARRPDGEASGGGAGAEPEVTFDAVAHTVTRDGDLPRCAECGQYAPAPHGHPECQPEALAGRER